MYLCNVDYTERGPMATIEIYNSPWDVDISRTFTFQPELRSSLIIEASINLRPNIEHH